MDEATAYALAGAASAPRKTWRNSPPTRLTDIEGMDEERAAALIMAARAPWFE
jgi:N utilization substance protein A